ncbi:MAG: glyoxalase/bleomycin resistance/dioxygenase family protein [Gammaproteobacteria bacterium]|jgi:catechol-2,3-dioxygenase|nr:glyoxalase/bleomycin resistance/dioxygenase family protein [Gammaproteobacteria bacterium]
MKRIHIHLQNPELDAAVRFYTRLFQAEPQRLEPDYARWRLENPPLTLAISTGGTPHLGIALDDAAELQTERRRMDAEIRTDEGEVECCYAVSDKFWLTDPAGTAWEVFHTRRDALATRPAGSAACCEPESGCC